jgi:hypothetical protein
MPMLVSAPRKTAIPGHEETPGTRFAISAQTFGKITSTPADAAKQEFP